MKTYKKTVLIFLSFITISLVIWSNIDIPNKENKKSALIDEAVIKEAKAYCEKNNFNNDLFVFIDMKIHSGKNRFYVWDFNSKKIIKSCLVSHGCGNNAWSNDFSKDSPTFSNVPDSHQSSLGKYKIGERGYSNWGVHTKYLLHGMESSNNKALQRNIVFHSWNAIADNEVFPSGTPEGWGCPAISNENFKFVDSLIQQSNKPTLMWIYNG